MNDHRTRLLTTCFRNADHRCPTSTPTVCVGVHVKMTGDRLFELRDLNIRLVEAQEIDTCVTNLQDFVSLLHWMLKLRGEHTSGINLTGPSCSPETLSVKGLVMDKFTPEVINTSRTYSSLPML